MTDLSHLKARVETPMDSKIREEIARTLWLRRQAVDTPNRWDEYLAWYKEGLSDPLSVVYYSTVAMAFADADALLPLLQRSYQDGQEAMRERAADEADANMHSSVMPGHVGKNIAASIRSLPLSDKE